MSMSQNEGRNFPGFLAEMNRFSRFPTETSQFQKRFTIEIRNFDASPDVGPPKKGPGANHRFSGWSLPQASSARSHLELRRGEDEGAWRWWTPPVNSMDALPATNIAMENPPFWWYLPGKMGIFMGYVSFREGMYTDDFMLVIFAGHFFYHINCGRISSNSIKSMDRGYGVHETRKHEIILHVMRQIMMWWIRWWETTSLHRTAYIAAISRFANDCHCTWAHLNWVNDSLTTSRNNFAQL